MSLLFDLDDFPETRTVWEPVNEPPSPFDGLDEAAMLAAYKADNGAAWKVWQKSIRCRDCGSLLSQRPSKASCGGAGGGVAFKLCDDCATLDGSRLISHTTVVEDAPPHFGWPSQPREAAHCETCGWWLDAATRSDDDPFVLVPLTADEIIDLCIEHETPRWDSRWGMCSTPAEHDRLLVAQAQRRAKYLRERTA